MADEFYSWADAVVTRLGHDRKRPFHARDLTHDQTTPDESDESIVGNHGRVRLCQELPHLFAEDRAQCLAEVSNVDPLTTYFVTWQVPNDVSSLVFETWTWCDRQVVDPTFPYGEAGDGLDDVASNPFNSRLPSTKYAWAFRRTRTVAPSYLVSAVETVDSGEEDVRLRPSDMASIPGGRAFSARKKEVRAPESGSFAYPPDPAGYTQIISHATLILVGSSRNVGIWRRVSGIRVTRPNVGNVVWPYAP